MSATDTTRLKTDQGEAEISPHGAELVALRDAAGRDFLWDGDPAYWTGRAPLLFPIVGKVPDDRLRVGEKTYPMRQHGLARLSAFTRLAHDATSVTYRLDASDATRQAYPFDFRLDVRYALAGATLSIAATVENRGATPMPVAFGFHPALRWPLPGGGAKEAHSLTFAEAEPDPVRRLSGGLLRPAPQASPVTGNHLALDEDLFAADVVVLDAVRSRSVTYRGPTGPGVRVGFPTMPHLGLWSKPGAGFLCIEPWQGYAAPEGFDGDLADKPGSLTLAPAATRVFAMSLEILP